MKWRRRSGEQIQRELGTSDDVRGIQREPPGTNTLSVRLELRPAACDTLSPNEV